MTLIDLNDQDVLVRKAVRAAMLLRPEIVVPQPEFAIDPAPEPETKRSPPSRVDVIRMVAAFYGRTFDELVGKSRKAFIVLPRHVAMYLVKNVLNKTWGETAFPFGHRDHTTAIHACRKIERMIEYHGELASDVAHLEAQIIKQQVAAS